MQKTVVGVALLALTVGCASVSPGGAGAPTEESLMRADRDFAAATHARGIEGWMSFYANDAIRIRYRGNMVRGHDAIR
jgi:hypothetical protein